MDYKDRITGLIKMLKSAPCSYEALVLMSGMTYKTVFEWVKAWVSAGLVEQTGWEKDARGHETIMLWRWK